MGTRPREQFRLTVLNPGGRDREQHFDTLESAGKDAHAPVNFHAYAACTHGSFQSNVRRAIAEETPVLVLLRGDFKASLQAVRALKTASRTVVVSLKETGLHQIADQLSDPSKLARFVAALHLADGAIGATLEAADFFASFNGAKKRAAYIPTPYPVEGNAWDYSLPQLQRAGILVGTREWDVPSRNHLAAVQIAQRIGHAAQETITVFNFGEAQGRRLLRALGPASASVRVLEHKLSYTNYLAEVARHKVVWQLDTSFVPGQVAGDALLCGLPCVGGNGAIDRLAFPHLCGWNRSFEELTQLAIRLCADPSFYADAVNEARAHAHARVSFAVVARELADFFARLS
ncbi:MAG TPA: hypothetical protein VGQ82_04740 [Chthoniobacterales bacterium]|nr:hypothetical protein [Chthoniobacterales bacterium]